MHFGLGSLATDGVPISSGSALQDMLYCFCGCFRLPLLSFINFFRCFFFPFSSSWEEGWPSTVGLFSSSTSSMHFPTSRLLQLPPSFSRLSSDPVSSWSLLPALCPLDWTALRPYDERLRTTSSRSPTDLIRPTLVPVTESVRPSLELLRRLRLEASCRNGKIRIYDSDKHGASRLMYYIGV